MHGLNEVAGQNYYSVQGLKELGEKAETVVYYKHPFAYPYDECLEIDKSNRKMFPIYALKLVCFFLKAMKRYNCFHFHFGHSILNGFELPVYRWCRKKLFFEFHGSDLRDYETFCKISGMPFNINEATNPKQHKRNQKICRMANGVIVHDDELLPYLPDICAPTYVVPLRVDVSRFEPLYPDPETEIIRIVHAPSKRAVKGTEYVLKAFEELKKKNYTNIELILVEGKTQQEALELYKKADIVVDQLFVGTYGVFAIESMAMGKPVITYISEEMEKNLPEDLPILSANRNTLVSVLEKLINEGDLRRNKGIAGRKYVEDYHDYRYGASILRDIYYGRAEPLNGRKAFHQVKERKNNAEKIVNAGREQRQQ